MISFDNSPMKAFRIYSVCIVAMCMALCHSLFAQQPQLRYIQPDIGAPGMSVYVEFIADVNALGTFGPDGLYVNNRPVTSGTITVQVLTDTSQITTGPIVVSWNGRLLSTYLFIKSTARTSAYPSDPAQWQTLSSRTALSVVVNGVASVPQFFHIVNPLRVGDISNQAQRTVFGQATSTTQSIGIRSPRGAMLIDTLYLGGRTYTVSTLDPDPATAGNQGFLPFILMSPSIIRGGIGGTTTIDASALGKHGGPGGGGGGGNTYNRTIGLGNTGNTDRATAGGNGFTGGGAGSVNRGASFNGSQFWKAAGSGSGETRDSSSVFSNPILGGVSLNGVPGGTAPAYENGGGGTGHPFGISGNGAPDQGTGVAGRFGGGSGPQNQHPGGGGGYATNGNSLNSNDNGGKAHGNTMIVPLAGGSGGASGNPDGNNTSSGFGGGGGGAILLYAPIIEQVFVNANGGTSDIANSGISDEPRGGGGSGGAIITATRIQSFFPGSLSVLGGNQGTDTTARGGRGYLRSDGAQFSPGTAGSGQVFEGFSADTTNFIYGDGTDIYDGASSRTDSVDIYERYDNGGLWTGPTRIGVGASGSTWVYTIPRFPFVAQKQIAVVRAVPNASATSATSTIPTHILSAAGANQLTLTPRIDRIDRVDLGEIRYTPCTNLSNLSTSAVIRNASPLLPLTITIPTQTGATLGLLIRSTTVTIATGGSTRINISYTIPPSGRNSSGVDRFSVFHNDMLQQNPLELAVQARFTRIAPNALFNSAAADFVISNNGYTTDINMGSAMGGQTIVRDFPTHLVNLSDAATTMRVDFINVGRGLATATTSTTTFLPNQLVPFTVRWAVPATNASIVYDTIQVRVTVIENGVSCSTTLTMNLRASLSRSALAVTSTGGQILQATNFSERIPIRAQVNNIGASNFSAQLRGVLTYNPAVFYLRSVTSAITGISVQWRTESVRGGDNPLRALIFDATFANVPALSALSDIVNMEGTPLLGNTSATTLAWITSATASVQAGITSGEFTRWLGGTNTTANFIVPTLDQVSNGDIALDVCIEGGQPRLGSNANTLSARSAPNPANDVITIRMTTQEPGGYLFDIANIFGAVVYSGSVVLQDTSEHSISIPVHDWSSGAYILRVYPAGRASGAVSVPINIVR